MTQMRELEQIHNEKLQDIAVSTLEKIMKNELPDDLPDDVRMVSGYFQRVCDILQFQPVGIPCGGKRKYFEEITIFGIFNNL